MEIIICVAASASGKSTFIDRFPKKPVEFSLTGDPHHEDGSLSMTLNESFAADTLLLDGDSLIGALLGWPSMEDWHKFSVGNYVSFINMACVLEMCSRLQRKFERCVVLWNAEVWPFHDVLELYRGSYTFGEDEVTFCLVEIPSDVHKEYVTERNKAFAADPNKGKNYPGSWREAQNNRAALRKMRDRYLNDEVMRWHEDVFDSFDQVLEAFAA